MVAGLTASGLPSGEFHFVGFLPQKGAQRRRRLESLRPVPGTWVFYESPYRIEKLLTDLSEIYPAAEVVVGRELTKKFEEFLRGRPGEILAATKGRSLKGEFVVVVKANAGDSPGEV